MMTELLIPAALVVGAVASWTFAGRRARRWHDHARRLASDRRRYQEEIRATQTAMERMSQDERLHLAEVRAGYEREAAPYRRLRDRLGLVMTMDGEYAVPNLDRLWSEDFPNARPLGADGMVKWSDIWADQRAGGSCYLHAQNAVAERDRIMREEMPRPAETRWREAKYPDGRVVKFHMDRPETWPPEIRAIGTRERAALESSPPAMLDLAKFVEARTLDRVALPPADGTVGGQVQFHEATRRGQDVGAG